MCLRMPYVLHKSQLRVRGLGVRGFRGLRFRGLGFSLGV